jgi:hypothetical protein
LKTPKCYFFLIIPFLFFVITCKNTVSNKDSKPSEMFVRNYGGGGHDFARFVQQTTDEGYIIAGSTESIGNGLSDFWLIKTDSEGNEEWNQTYGGVENDWGRSVKQTTDEGYIIAGSAKSIGNGLYDFWLIKTDSEGNTIPFGV